MAVLARQRLTRSSPAPVSRPSAQHGSRLRPASTRRCKPRHGVAGRTSSVNVRADVNWDAFRPSNAARAGNNLFNNLPPYRAPGTTNSVQQVDFLVLGSGIAGLSYALKVAEYGSVAIVTKDFANEGCTQYAQGGVCAVLDGMDSVSEHVRDTMVAGAFLNEPQAVDVVCREGPARVLELAAMGAAFTTNRDGSLHLTKEGGHSKRRIVHAADVTGREIERALLAAARSHRNIRFFEHHLAVDLVVDDSYQGVPHCFGADVLDQRSMTMTRFIALSTMMACGGAGQVYPNTTNPHVATGDGIAMAYRAAAPISNMEFIQFHPTALYDPTNSTGGRSFLISEAVRGEGGVLLNGAGERFMSKYDVARMELAPRDVVARSIQHEMLQRGEPHVLLDISHKPRHDVLDHFPNIAAKCAELGIDITRDPIPVLPAQHYTCGGVATGLLGETGVQGLYACGEVACSGLHGANRLASNSLLEGLVFADRAAGPSVAHAEHALRSCGRQLHYAAASTSFVGPRGPKALTPAMSAWVDARRQELRDTMWRTCGIVRNVRDMSAALEQVSALGAEVHSTLSTYGINTPLVELHNLATVAEITLASALQRRESRGGHYCLDYPAEVEAERRPSMVTKDGKVPAGAAARRKVAKKQPAAVPVSVGILGPTPGIAPGAPGGGGGGGATSSPAVASPAVVARKSAAPPPNPKKKVVQRDMVMRSLPENHEP